MAAEPNNNNSSAVALLEQQLVPVLAACLSADQAERAAAEAALKQHEAVPGLIVALLRVAMLERAGGGLDMGVRQVAVIQFKNTVKRRWEASSESASGDAGGDPAAVAPQAATTPPASTPPLAEADRVAVRENLLEALMAAPHAVQVQLGDAFKAIAYCDFPERWPSLLPGIQSALAGAAAAGSGAGADAADPASPAGARMHGALYALRILARKYEFRDEGDRAPLKGIIAGTFPVLLALMQQLLANPTPSPGVAKLVLKVFWSATFMGVPDELLRQEQFAGWLTCLHQALTMPVPADTPPSPSAPFWKALKWVLHITYRMYSRYGEPRLAREGNDRAFAALFVQHGSHQLLEDHLALLAQLAVPGGGAYLSPRVITLALQYVGRAVELKDSYKLLRPHLDPLLQSIVFPLVCFGEEDAELWEQDPQEYIRKGYDVLEDMYSTKTAAANLLHVLVTKKAKAGHLDKVMAQIAGVFVEHAAAAAATAAAAASAGGGGAAAAAAAAAGSAAAGAVPVDLARRMDGAMLVVGSLSDVLKSKSPYKEQLETMLMTHVLPCFASPHGHLRSKAAWVSGCYSDIVFSGCGVGAGPHFMLLFERVVNGLHDPELPVRVDSVVAMRAFVSELADMDQLKPILPRLLESIFGLMHEVDSEDLVSTLEAIVEKLGEDVGPHALTLAQNLTGAFWRYTQQGDGDEEEDNDDATMAAYGCLRSMLTLLDGCTGLKTLLPQLEEIMFPLMQKLISSEGQDVFEEMLEMLSYFTFFEAPLSPRLWTLWPQLHSCLVEFAIDSWPALLVPLDNFISRDPATFLSGTNPNYQESVFAMVSHSLAGPASFHEGDLLSAPRLLCVVLQNCRGLVDRWVEPYLTLVVHRFAKTHRRALKDELMVVVANALYYDPALALGALQRIGAVEAVFREWFAMIFARKGKGSAGGKPQHFRLLSHKRAVALGLVSLLAVPDEALPPQIAAGLPQVLAGVLKVLDDLKTQEQEKQEDEEERDDEGGSGSDGEEVDDDEQEEEGFTCFEAPTRGFLGAHHRNEDDDVDDDADDGDSEDGWSDEDDDAESPIDAVCPFAFLADALSALTPSRAQVLATVECAAVAAAVECAAARRREAAAAEAKKQQAK